MQRVTGIIALAYIIQHAHKRQRIQELDLLRVGERPVHNLPVADDVLHQKRANGHDAGE